MATAEWHPKNWSILLGWHLRVWTFGLCLTLGPAEQELDAGFGPLSIYIDRQS